jgi:uncharacterized membrane protein
MRRVNIKSLVLTSLLFAVALVLAMLENLLPPVPIPVPGVKFGLANIVVMYALFFLNWKRAAAIVGLNALFVASVRGVVSGLLSLSGGVLSLLVMMALLGISEKKFSYYCEYFRGYFPQHRPVCYEQSYLHHPVFMGLPSGAYLNGIAAEF